jgi:hypothetical protein
VVEHAIEHISEDRNLVHFLRLSWDHSDLLRHLIVLALVFFIFLNCEEQLIHLVLELLRKAVVLEWLLPVLTLTVVGVLSILVGWLVRWGLVVIRRDLVLIGIWLSFVLIVLICNNVALMITINLWWDHIRDVWLAD